MPMYEYCCPHDGLFEVYRPVGSAPEALACTACGLASPRVLSAPVLRRAKQSALFAAMEHAERSAHEPDVVTSLPAAGRSSNRILKPTPELMRLPRP